MFLYFPDPLPASCPLGATLPLFKGSSAWSTAGDWGLVACKLPCTKAWARLPQPAALGGKKEVGSLHISSQAPIPFHEAFAQPFVPGNIQVSRSLSGLARNAVCSWLEQNVLVLKYSFGLDRDVFQTNTSLTCPSASAPSPPKRAARHLDFGYAFLDFRVLDGGLQCWEWREGHRRVQPVVTSPRDRTGILDLFLEVNSLKTGHWEYSVEAINPSPTLCCPPSISWNPTTL